jgi:hypothetical protein
MNFSYIEITDALNGTIQLEEVIDGNRMVGLREITYTADWFNVSKELGNNIYLIRTSDQDREYEIKDGYYNIALLETKINEEIKGFKLEHNLSSDIITMTLPKKTGVVYDFKNLAELLGCETGWLSGDVHTCKKPHKFYTHKALYVHLDQINTTQNILVKKKLAKRSNLLRKVSTNDVQFGECATISFEMPQFRRLCNGSINELLFSVLDIDGNKVNIKNCFITLEIRDI